jgi:cytoskeleton protein RodZ
MPARETADGTEKAANASSGPGGRLRQAREAQGLQLEEVANELRVSAGALAALEDNRFEALGAAVFAKGYLKQYGARLGLDSRELLALYEGAGGQPDVALAPAKGIRLRDERRISPWVVSAFALVIVGGAGYWWWRQSQIELASPAAAGDRDVQTTSPVAAVADESEVETPVLAGESTPSPAVEQAAEPDAELATALAVESPGAADEASSAAIDGPLLEGAPAPEGAESGRVLEVIFNQESWAEITDADGNRLYRDLGEPGTRARLPADRNLHIYFGQATAVELRLDGEVVPLPRAAPSGIVRFDLDDVID